MAAAVRGFVAAGGRSHTRGYPDGASRLRGTRAKDPTDPEFGRGRRPGWRPQTAWFVPTHGGRGPRRDSGSHRQKKRPARAPVPHTLTRPHPVCRTAGQAARACSPGRSGRPGVLAPQIRPRRPFVRRIRPHRHVYSANPAARVSATGFRHGFVPQSSPEGATVVSSRGCGRGRQSAPNPRSVRNPARPRQGATSPTSPAPGRSLALPANLGGPAGGSTLRSAPRSCACRRRCRAGSSRRSR